MTVADYLNDLFGLERKAAVVIGGTGVLGGALCEGLAKAGARVIVAGLDTQRGNQRAARIVDDGRVAAFCYVDATSRESIEALLEDALVRFGRVDCLINCAGVNHASSYLDVSDDDWQRVLDANLTGTHLGCQVFGRHMIESGGGAILNIGSVSSDRPLSRVFAYSASKAAVINLTRNLAGEFAPHGVRVNALCPGFFPAEQNRAILDTTRSEAVIRHTPLGRFGEPEELIGPALLLLSSAAGSFITGATLYVDGGFTAGWI